MRKIRRNINIAILLCIVAAFILETMLSRGILFTANDFLPGLSEFLTLLLVFFIIGILGIISLVLTIKIENAKVKEEHEIQDI